MQKGFMKNNNLVPRQNPPPSPDVGAPSQDEGEASNSGGVPAPTPPQFSLEVASTLVDDLTDRRAQFEALRRLVQRQLLENQQLLKSILEVEQASDWATHPAALNALSQITSDTKDFYAWLMQTSLKATHATANKK
jgi:hypothetical protein